MSARARAAHMACAFVRAQMVSLIDINKKLWKCAEKGQRRLAIA